VPSGDKGGSTVVDENDVSMSAAATGSGGGSAGGFEFDPGKIDGVIKQWQDLQTDLKHDENDARAMASVKAPGKEFASGDFEKSATPSGKAFLEQNARMQEYVKKYVDALLEAKRKITTKEADAQADIEKTGNRAP
jgi:hypothetical protein